MFPCLRCGKGIYHVIIYISYSRGVAIQLQIHLLTLLKVLTVLEVHLCIHMTTYTYTSIVYKLYPIDFLLCDISDIIQWIGLSKPYKNSFRLCFETCANHKTKSVIYWAAPVMSHCTHRISLLLTLPRLCLSIV